MRKIVALITLLLFYMTSEAIADSSDAFMSLPFGLSWTRTQKRMEQYGATTVNSQKGSLLQMEGMFEGREAFYQMTFVKKKGLSSKSVNIATLGDGTGDKNMYANMKKAYDAAFGTAQERVVKGGTQLTLLATWNPNATTTVTLLYDPDAKRFSETFVTRCPVRLSYVTSKWSGSEASKALKGRK
jgi:hypothetical protein